MHLHYPMKENGMYVLSRQDMDRIAAQVLSEYNYFTSSAHKAFNNQYTNTLPYCGYLIARGEKL